MIQFNADRKKVSIMGILCRASLAVLIIGIAAVHARAEPPSDMVAVPAGKFIMGTDLEDRDGEALMLGLPDPWYEDERPAHEVILPLFFIDRYEVTHADYEKFVEATEHPAPPDWIGGEYPPERARHPVAHVSWHDARDYCAWKGRRLPTEAEWEKAARGPDGRIYPWGNDFDPDRAHLARKAEMFGATAPVGRFKDGRSPYGAHDMIGNVWEWTESWYEAYPGNRTANEKFGEQLKVMRGLSFVAVGHYPEKLYAKVSSIVARASFRSYDVPEARLLDVGFRCAMSAK